MRRLTAGGGFTSQWTLVRWTLRLAVVGVIGLAALVSLPSRPAAAQSGDASSEPAVRIAADAAAPATPTEASTPATSKSLLGIVREGGIVMLPLLICSFVMLIFVFERAISLRRGRVIPGPFVKRFLHQLEDGQLDKEQALLVCEKNGSPVARVFAAACKKWARPAVEIEQAIIDAGERVVHELRHYLRLFNGLVTLSPMLGLLGTVCGMIRAFSDIATADAMGRPELLARGISEALLSTATGLAVAVPALVLYWWFVSVIDRLTVRIDALGQEVVGQISAEAIQEKAAAKPTRNKTKTAA